MLAQFRQDKAVKAPHRRYAFWLRLTAFSAIFLSLPSGIGAAYASEPPQQIEHAALQSLARDFISRVGGKLRQHDADFAARRIADNPLSVIPDGELLLLRPRTEQFVMNSEIGTIKNQGTLYYSLDDLITQLELAIDYNPERSTGNGWFLREDWLVRFDFNRNEVVSRNITYAIEPDDIYKDGDDIYISASPLKTWLSIEAEPDIAQQYLNLKTPYPYAPLARDYRDRKTNGRLSRNAPILPRIEVEESMFDINVVETQQSLRVRKPADGKSTTTHQNITAASGELLKHNAYGIALWDSENNLNSVRGHLSKESENADLLGPLGARFYAMGDIEQPQIPLASSSTQGLGVRINNNPLRNADFQKTTVSGDGLPGWDVELYRDGFLVDRIAVDDTARYEFPDIDLFAGDNLFEVFFYGPQGEIRRDSFNIPVNEKFLSTQDNTYDFAVSLQDTQLYNKHDNDDEDAKTLQLIARYNKLIGNTLAYAGIRTHQNDGEQKTYLGTGFTNVWNGFVFDTNAAIDEEANKAIEISTRKNINDWRLSLIGRARDEDFSGSDSSGVLDIHATANRNFITPFNTRLNFNTSAQYQEMANDDQIMTGRAGVSHQFGRLTLSDTLSYRRTELGDDTKQNPEDTIFNTLAGRMSFGKVFTSAGMNYNIKPESEVDSYFAQLSYRPNNKINTDLRLQHKPKDDHSQARLNVSYTHDKFRVTPYVNVDSDDNMETGVRLSTTFMDDPGQTLPAMSYRKLTHTGLVSSFVFHDKNGNNIFDEGDEALPDVVVQSVNVARQEVTNQDGYSLISNLPERMVTDIEVDKNSLPDPFMIPANKGVSVFPKAGQMVNLVFPIHMAGEVDGVVQTEDNGIKLPQGGIQIHLYPIDGKSDEPITTTSAGDGFYLFNHVPPGQYILGVDADRTNKMRYGGGKPTFVTIGYDGTTLYGQNITLQKNRVQTPFELQPYTGGQYDRPFFALQTGSTAKSALAVTLEKIMSSRTAALQDDLKPFPMEGNGNLKYLPGYGLMEHYDRCAALNDARVPCKVILYIPQKTDPAIRTAQR